MSQVTSVTKEDDSNDKQDKMKLDFTPDTERQSEEQLRMVFPKTSTSYIKGSPIEWDRVKSEIDLPPDNNLSIDDNIKAIEAKARIEQDAKDRENNRNIKNSLFDLLKLIFYGIFAIYFLDVILIAGGHNSAAKDLFDIAKQIVVMILGYLFGRERQ